MKTPIKKEGKKKIVYIDNYDSFANTIAAYFINAGADVVMYKSDCSIDMIDKENPDLILLGPGPNSPKEAGNYLKILKRYHKKYPFFGICLGFQAMMEFFGEPVLPLDEVIHGAASRINHNCKTIFQGIDKDAEFARYHSLGVKKVPDCFNLSAKTDSGIVMAACHKTLPIVGIQFHPESILSMHEDSGKRLIKNVLSNIKRDQDERHSS